MIDFNSRSALSDRINFLIDEQIDKTAAEAQRREYLGASVIGHICERHVQYHLLAAQGHVERKQPEARVLRIFDRGHVYEERSRQWLKDSGFIFSPIQRELKDFGDQFAGHEDGVLVGWDNLRVVCPIILPALWEHKCLSAKNWKKVSTDKLKNYSSIYFAQVQLYMHYLQLQRCLFTATNADTMELYHELVEYDEAEALSYKARVERVIQATAAGELVPRCTNDRNFYQCKWCDFARECWT